MKNFTFRTVLRFVLQYVVWKQNNYYLRFVKILKPLYVRKYCSYGM